MNTPTTITHPATVRAAFRRAARTLADLGIQAALSDPTCCRSCASVEVDSDKPYLVGYRMDGTSDSRGIFSGRSTSAVIEYLSWENGYRTWPSFFAAVTMALADEGFEVTVPETKSIGIAVRYVGKVAAV